MLRSFKNLLFIQGQLCYLTASFLKDYRLAMNCVQQFEKRSIKYSVREYPWQQRQKSKVDNFGPSSKR